MRKRIDWTLLEQSDWHNAFLLELQQRKVPLPVSAQYMKEVMASAREALKVLKVERRRPFTSADSFRGVSERLIDAGVFPRDYLKSLRRGARGKRKLDQKDEKIALLEQALAKRDQQQAEDGEVIARLQAQVQELENQPSPLAVLENFLVSVIRRGLKPEESPKPHGITVKATIPQHEKDRRKDPMGFAAALAGGNTKPKFAIVSSFEDIDKAKLHTSLSGAADMRYIDGINKFTSLGRFNADGGRIILWADKCPPNWEAELQNMGVSFHRHRGPESSLVQHVKEMVSK